MRLLQREILSGAAAIVRSLSILRLESDICSETTSTTCRSTSAYTSSSPRIGSTVNRDGLKETDNPGAAAAPLPLPQKGAQLTTSNQITVTTASLLRVR